MTRSQVLQGRMRFVCAVLVFLVLAPSAFSQMAEMKWTKIANFPEPAEEILGTAANGKMYVFAGLIPLWHPKGLVYEYDPATDKWTKKKPMALPSHHVAFTEYKGKIYAFGGFVYPQSGPPSWVPIDNAWEYDPAADTWKALAPMPIKRGAALASAANGKIYVVGGATSRPGAKDIAITPTTPQVVLGTVEEYDPETNTWRERSPMPTPRNHAAIGTVNGKIYVIGGRVGEAFIAPSTDVSVVEEYDPGEGCLERGAGPHAYRAQRACGRRLQREDLHRGWRISGSHHDGHVPRGAGLRPGDEFLVDAAVTSGFAPWTRRRHDRQSLLCGRRRRAIVGNGNRCVYAGIGVFGASRSNTEKHLKPCHPDRAKRSSSRRGISLRCLYHAKRRPNETLVRATSVPAFLRRRRSPCATALLPI